MLKFMPLTRKQRTLLITLTLLIILAIVYAAFRYNIHTVIPGEVYRSAQLSADGIDRLVHLKKIKTIINLRGKNEKMPWYEAEVKESKALHLKHFDITLNSKSLPTSQQLQQLTELLQHSPTPILIHCKSGIDRTGLVSAMALILLKKSTLKEAKGQFSWHYLVTSEKSVGKLVFTNYEKWLKKNKLISSKKSFIRWVHNA